MRGLHDVITPENLDAYRMDDSAADQWTAANDAVDEAAVAIELKDGLMLGNTQRRTMLTAVLRAITRAIKHEKRGSQSTGLRASKEGE